MPAIDRERLGQARVAITNFHTFQLRETATASKTTAEFAEEIVEAMDLYRAGRAVASLGPFVDDLRGALKRLPAGD